MESTSPAPTPPEKKGLSGLAIAGIGCGGLMLIALLGVFLLLGKACSKVKEFATDFQKNPAKAAAMLAVKGDPELEIVSTDDTKGQVTIHNKKTGDDVTMSFDDIAKGKFSMKNSKGEEINVDASGAGGKGSMVIKGKDGTTVFGGDAAASAPPAWVLLYPGSTALPGNMRVEKDDAINGSYMLETGDPAAKVKEFYDSKLKEQGFKIETMMASADGKDSANVSGDKEAEKRKINAMINTEGGKTTVVLVYEGPKN